MRPQKDDYAGTTINGYLLIEHIASGDFGETYRAKHPEQDDSVAIKLFSKEISIEEKSELFCINEHLLTELSHPHLLPILALERCKDQVDDHNCQLYVITPYAVNGTLRARIQERAGQPFPLDEALSILTLIGQAIQYLHQHNIVHRGIQPESILFDGQNRPLLGEMDLAIIDGSHPAGRSGWVLGTKFYRALEQFYMAVDKQSDQFALACIAYELLTGQHPFSPGLTRELERDELRKALADYTKPGKLNPTIPDHVEKVLAKALSQNAGDRYPDVMTFLSALSASDNSIEKHAFIALPPTTPLAGIQPGGTKQGTLFSFPNHIEDPLSSDFAKLDGKVAHNQTNNANHPQPTFVSSTERSTDFVIITALQEEREALLEKLPFYHRLPPNDEDIHTYYQTDLPVTFSDGTTSTYRLIILSLPGIGRVQAANATNDAIKRWHPRYILLVGIAGGIAEAKVKHGDILISDQIIDYELQKLTETGPQIRWEVHRADPRLLAATKNMKNNWRGLIKKRRPQKGGKAECFIGPVATGDKVVARKKVVEQLQKSWQKLLGIEMEAGGVASAAFQSVRQPGFLMIRGVSDLADKDKNDIWHQYACHSAAAYAIALLQSGPVPPNKSEKTDNRNTEIMEKDKHITNSILFKPIQSKPLELKIPEMGKHFLGKQDRSWVINIVDTVIEPMSTEGIKNLLRDKLPEHLITRFKYKDSSRNLAEEITGALESRGTALNSSSDHALGAFLIEFIENDLVSHDAAVKIVALLFGYALTKDREQIAKLSAQFQVPSHLLTEELLINHPFTFSSSLGNINTTNLQEHFESLYNRRRYLLDVNFLSQGARVAGSVCRIDFDKRGEGTGFLVAPDLILTNYHVMIPPGYRGNIDVRARKCEIKFGVIEGISAGIRRTLHDGKWCEEESKPEDLDFMLLRLNRPITASDQISPLLLEPNFIQEDEFVNIIQHPNGRSMEVSLRFNQVVAVEEKRIYYLADTEEGSSGSPVFDDLWRLVALHHSGGKLDGHGNLTIAANVGVPINPIWEKIAPYLNG